MLKNAPQNPTAACSLTLTKPDVRIYRRAVDWFPPQTLSDGGKAPDIWVKPCSANREASKPRESISTALIFTDPDSQTWFLVLTSFFVAMCGWGGQRDWRADHRLLSWAFTSWQRPFLSNTHCRLKEDWCELVTWRMSRRFWLLWHTVLPYIR